MPEEISTAPSGPNVDEDREGKVVFGLGDIAFWRRSIAWGRCQAAAKDLRMRYRAVWCRIKASEERLGKPLNFIGSVVEIEACPRGSLHAVAAV